VPAFDVVAELGYAGLTVEKVAARAARARRPVNRRAASFGDVCP